MAEDVQSSVLLRWLLVGMLIEFLPFWNPDLSGISLPPVIRSKHFYLNTKIRLLLLKTGTRR